MIHAPAGQTGASRQSLPPIQPYNPTTFLERGVAVPFTTPLLGGTRARPGEKNSLDLIVPNPSGGRGVYIMPWTAITALCQPTMHDKVLNERIARIRAITPGVLREVARGIAAEGLAGEAAIEAARAAVETEKDDLVVTNYRLLMALIAQVDVAPGSGPAILTPDAPELKQRAQSTTAWVAPRLGRPTAWVATALEDLANVLRPVGVGVGQGAGRVPRLIEMLREVTAEIDKWSRTQGGHSHAAAAQMICLVARFTLALAGDVLDRALAITADVLELLRAWAADAKSVADLIGRPEWLLDGWEPACLIWRHAGDDRGRRSALAEILALLPILPKEVGEWCEVRSDMDLTIRFRRSMRGAEDWRTGVIVHDLIARNEHFRALAP